MYMYVVSNTMYEMILDGKSKNVTVTGVGRIMWRKDYYPPRIANIIFKQYGQKSESQLGGSLIDSSQCNVLLTKLKKISMLGKLKKISFLRKFKKITHSL